MDDADPFRHHPGLRALITPPESSFFRSTTLEDTDALLARNGLPTGWRRSREDIHRRGAEALAGHRGDLWIFAYGSLIWDPAIRFTELRRARLPGFRRHFCLVDRLGARGTQERPGVMAALDTGPAEAMACDGVAFRIAAREIAEETPRLFERELIAPAYIPTFATAETDHGPVRALTFAADHAAEMIDADISRADQVRYAATGTGILGSSLDYVANLAAHFAELRIDAPEVTSLLAEARAFQEQQTV